MPESRDRQTTLRLPEDLLHALTEEARASDRSINSIAVRALRAYLADVQAAEELLRKLKP